MKLFDNYAFVGMVGNPNSLGLISCFVILFSYIFQNKLLRTLIIIVHVLFAALSGSLLSVLGVVLSLIMIIPAVWKLVISFATCIAFIYLVQVVTFIKGITFMPIAFLHFVDKLQSLSDSREAITFGAVVGAHSIDNRLHLFWTLLIE